jgi:hypothetical protein
MEDFDIDDCFIPLEKICHIFGCHKTTVYRKAGKELPDIRCFGGRRGMLLSELRSSLTDLPKLHDVRSENLAATERAAAARRAKKRPPELNDSDGPV